MKRQFFATVLALCLTLTLLPAWALAAEPDSTEYWIDMSAEEAQAMLRAVAGKSESRYIVFVYYDAATAPNPIESQFRTYANEKGYYIYGYHTGTGGSLTDVLAPLFEGSTALTLPVAVTWNPSTQTCMAKDNVRTMIDNAVTDFNGLVTLMEANGLGHGSSVPGGTDTPPPVVDPGATGGSSIADVSEQAWEVLRLLNIYRMEKGLQPLSTFAEVQEAANIRAKELFLYCSHTRPNFTSYETVFQEVGAPALSTKITSWAENIASGQRDAADVMTSWKLSPGHNANMIKPTGRVHVGIGYDYQTNGNPSLYAANWVQNFVAAYDCSFTNLQLSQYSIEGKPGTDLETLLKEADIEVTAICYRHGKSSLPLIAAMCSGYDANSTDTQELTVTYGGQTATLTVTSEGHIHEWNAGSVTNAATCTDPGRMTYTCTSCGAVKTETIPATGHQFIKSEDGAYSCKNGDTAIPADCKLVYEELTTNTEENKLFYPHGAEGIDMSADETTVMSYLTEYTEDVLEKADTTNYSCDILDGQFIENHTKFEYRIGIRALESPEPQTLFALRSYDYILITEPMILLLNYVSGADPAPEEATDVVTPNGNVSEGNAPAPSEPQPPSDPSGPQIPSGPSESQTPSRPSGGASSSTASVYHISVPQAAGGQVILNPSSASQGQRVTVTVQPDSGYTLDTLKAADANGNEVALRNLGNGSYEFTMPASKVTFTVIFEQVHTEPALNPVPMPFIDVPGESWFYSGVDYVWKHYLMNGVSDTHFNPDGTTSRAMLWTILARMHGVSTDTDLGTIWYEQGQLWAIQQGVSDGTNPTNGVTREQIATMLWRDAGSPDAAIVLHNFGDSSLVSDYAETAIRWAVETGIMQGANGMLNPKNTASRAEMSVMIARYAAQIS